MGNVIAASMAFSVGGALMKASHGFHRLLPSLVIGSLFVVGAALMARAVSRDHLSRAFVMGLGIEAVSSVVIGALLLGERLALGQWTGVGLIVVGVAILRS